MGRNINTGTLTKSYILNKISQISIFSEYLNISDNIIQNCINTGEFILSPIRDDDFPTVGFKYNNRGNLKMKDFAGYFWGDCFDLVALVISNMYKRDFDVSNKTDFIHILRHISITFSNIFYNKDKDPNLTNEIKCSINSIKKRKPNIELVIRVWNEIDELYWKQFGISLQYLNTHFIYPVEQYYIDRKFNPEPKYYYNDKDPCYGYFLGKDYNNNLDNLKLYFPNRGHDSTRFITNCNHLEGIYNLEKHDYDIICVTKSTKDRLSIGSTLYTMNYKELNIGVINIPHETYKLRNLEYNWLRSKLNDNGKICSLMDNDRVGKLAAKHLRDSYNITPIIISRQYNSKDFAEFIHNTSIKETRTIILKTIKYIINYDTEYNKLIRDKKKSNACPF